MRDSRTIWYQGARYQLGRAGHGYAIWVADGPPSRPVEQWPETPPGWAAAWSRFTAVEVPGTIAHLAPPADPPARVTAALALLAAGLVARVAGLFPGYLSGSSLAQQAGQLVPHVIYLAVWAASAVLIAAGGGRRRAGVLLGLGTSIVTFGFFLSDVGTVIAAGSRALGPGLILGVAGWLACTAGCGVLFRPAAGDLPRRVRGLDRRVTGMVVVASLAALGAACAFAPSWDRYTLHTAAGLTRSVTAGNSFANPGPVLAGDMAVMVALVVVAVFAALWRPARLGAALLAGAVIPMVATAVSALVQIREPLSSAAFGIPPAQAAQAGITISAGVTPAFWIYCAFVLALAMVCAGMLFPSRPSRPAGGYAPRPGGGPAPLAGEPPSAVSGAARG